MEKCSFLDSICWVQFVFCFLQYYVSFLISTISISERLKDMAVCKSHSFFPRCRFFNVKMYSKRAYAQQCVKKKGGNAVKATTIIRRRNQTPRAILLFISDCNMFLTQTLGYLRNREVKREGANLLERKEACNSAANFAAVRNRGGGGHLICKPACWEYFKHCTGCT